MSRLLLLGNPARRRKSRRTPSAAQKRARAAFAARYGRKRRARTITIAANPARRRRHTRHIRRNPARRSSGHSVGASMRSVTPMLKSAAVGATGALAVDSAFGFLSAYVPASMQSPQDATGGINPMYYLAKGALAIGLGIATRKMLGAKAGQMVEGSLTVSMHSAMVQLVQSTGMAIPLGNMPGGQILPPLPISQNLRGLGLRRSSIGLYPAQQGSTLGMYVGANARENGPMR